MITAGEGACPERKLRVLVVEDESVIALSLKVQLEAIGCEVVGTARDADGAVELARSSCPDVVLMDLGLPGKSGIEATRAITAEMATQVILVTAYSDERVDRALAAGACSVLTKPIGQQQLARAIAKATRGKPARRPASPPTEGASG
jgi:CheY-like chemotaxis protein